MAFPGAPNPALLSLDILFPDHYEASKRTIARDFIFFGTSIAGSIILAAMINLAMA